MDPRVRISAAALRDQYALARDLTTIMDRSFADAGAAKAARRDSAEDLFNSVNEGAATLLDTIDGADAPPTAQATAAVGALRARLSQIEGHGASPRG